MQPITSLMFSVLLWSGYASSTSAASFFDVSRAEYFDTVSVRDVTPPAVRSRRSTDKMPYHLHFEFSTRSHTVRLRLRRSQHINLRRLPVFAVGDNQELVKEELPEVANSAVYGDVGQGAAIVARSQNGTTGFEFQLHGTLHLGNKEYIITPSSSLSLGGAESRPAEAGLPHVLRATGKDDTYGKDYLKPETAGDDHIATRNGVNDKRRRRSRRQVNPTNSLSHNRCCNIDINIVCDYGCYQRFHQRHGGVEKLALEEARLYFAYLAQSIDLRFRSISYLRSDVRLSVTPVSVIIAKTVGGSAYTQHNRIEGTNGVNGNGLLEDFRTWASSANLTRAAATILQTGYDMMTEGDREKGEQLGIGYRGGACGSSGVVVVEEKFQGLTGMTAAHELGHSLNAKHDGSYSAADSECVGDDDRYVMSRYIGVPMGSSKPWSFSRCSADSIVQFVAARRGSCFTDNYEQTVAENAGQAYDADEQCAMAFGTGSYFCRGRQMQTVGYGGLCTQMYCSTDPTADDSCTSITPLEFTSCGDRKWCVRGQCVPDLRAPSKVHDSCAQGDDPSYGCRSTSCGPYLRRKVFCCQTCHQRGSALGAPVSSVGLYPPFSASSPRQGAFSNTRRARRSALFSRK